MIYEGGKIYNTYIAKFDLEHINQLYYSSPEKTDINYHSISIETVTNPDTQYVQTFPIDNIAIGWIPKVNRVTPTSRIEARKY